MRCIVTPVVFLLMGVGGHGCAAAQEDTKQPIRIEPRLSKGQAVEAKVREALQILDRIAAVCWRLTR